DLVRRRLDAVDATKTAHEFLEGKRFAVYTGGDDFGVENEGLAPKSVSRDLDDLRQTVGHFGQPAAPDAHAIAVFVDLHACAVVFVLERRLAAVRFENFGEICRELGEHRQQRHEQFYVDPFERLCSFGEGDHGHFGQ